MSYIDTIKHELVGFLNGLPIYHPLETVTAGGWGEADFSCSPANLIIGGGGGEHPALVVHHPGALVANYLLYDIGQKVQHFPHRYSPPPERVMEKLYDYSLSEGSELEFCQWPMRRVHDFIESPSSAAHQSPLQAEQSAEEWIMLSIGEFIYFSLPELNPLRAEITVLEGLENVGYWLCNVTCPPPGYIKSKKASLADSSFRLHGFFRWDYRYPPDE